MIYKVSNLTSLLKKYAVESIAALHPEPHEDVLKIELHQYPK